MCDFSVPVHYLLCEKRHCRSKSLLVNVTGHGRHGRGQISVWRDVSETLARAVGARAVHLTMQAVWSRGALCCCVNCATLCYVQCATSLLRCILTSTMLCTNSVRLPRMASILPSSKAMFEKDSRAQNKRHFMQPKNEQKKCSYTMFS